MISWTPLAADYTRFSRTRRSSFWGAAFGYFVPVVWLYSLGVLLLLARDISDPAQLPAAVVAGGVVSVLALLAVTVDESDEAFANVYSTAVSLQNVLPRVSQRLLIVASAAIATAGALVLEPLRLRHLPLPARLVLRAAARRAARRLAARRQALHPREGLPRPRRCARR